MPAVYSLKVLKPHKGGEGEKAEKAIGPKSTADRWRLFLLTRVCYTTTAALTTLAKIPTEVRWPSFWT